MQFSPAKAAVALKHGIGHISRPTDIRGVPAWETKPFRSLEDGAKLVNENASFGGALYQGTDGKYYGVR